MTGTKAGGLKAAATNKAKYGEDIYQRIGKIGGQNGHTGGFYANRELARTAGAKGGRISRRGFTLEQKAVQAKVLEKTRRKAHRKHLLDNIIRRHHA